MLAQLSDGVDVTQYARSLVWGQLKLACKDEAGDFCESAVKTLRGIPQALLVLIGNSTPNTAIWWACF